MRKSLRLRPLPAFRKHSKRQVCLPEEEEEDRGEGGGGAKEEEGGEQGESKGPCK